jgi:hypothetical protein
MLTVTESVQITLGVFYIILFLVACIQTYRLVTYSRMADEYTLTTQQVFHFFMVFCMITRTIYFFLLGNGVTNAFEVLGYILLSIPAYLYLSAYLLLIFFWAELYHFAYGSSSNTFVKRFLPHFVILNIAIYSIVILAFILYSVFLNTNEYIAIIIFKVEACFAASISIIAGLGFMFYGTKLYQQFAHFAINAKSKNKLRQVGLLAGICTVCFVLRAIAIMFVEFVDVPNEIGAPIILFIFYGILEIVPSILMLYVQRPIRPKQDERLALNRPLNSDASGEIDASGSGIDE